MHQQQQPKWRWEAFVAGACAGLCHTSGLPAGHDKNDGAGQQHHGDGSLHSSRPEAAIVSLQGHGACPGGDRAGGRLVLRTLRQHQEYAGCASRRMGERGADIDHALCCRHAAAQHQDQRSGQEHDRQTAVEERRPVRLLSRMAAGAGLGGSMVRDIYHRQRGLSEDWRRNGRSRIGQYDIVGDTVPAGLVDYQDDVVYFFLWSRDTIWRLQRANRGSPSHLAVERTHDVCFRKRAAISCLLTSFMQPTLRGTLWNVVCSLYYS